LAETSARGSTSVPRRSQRLDRGDQPISMATLPDCDWARRVNATSPDGTTMRLARPAHGRQIGLPLPSRVTRISSASFVSHLTQDPDAPTVATAGMPGRCSAGGLGDVGEPLPSTRLRAARLGRGAALRGIVRCVLMSSKLERTCRTNDPKKRSCRSLVQISIAGRSR
jgi:hypothetical protein